MSSGAPPWSSPAASTPPPPSETIRGDALMPAAAVGSHHGRVLIPAREADGQPVRGPARRHRTRGRDALRVEIVLGCTVVVGPGDDGSTCAVGDYRDHELETGREREAVAVGV